MAVCGNCRYYDGNTRSGGKGYCTTYKCYVWPDSMERGCTRYEQGTGSGSGCYLTSACVKAQGLADDCYELQTLRAFRDGYMKALPEGEEEIRHYYRVAPAIVEAVGRKADANAIWQELYEQMILPCLHFIEAGQNDKAHELYRSCSLKLEEAYL